VLEADSDVIDTDGGALTVIACVTEQIPEAVAQ
jgi:hypothetical protein